MQSSGRAGSEDDAPEAVEDRLRWPLWLWLAQLLPCAFLALGLRPVLASGEASRTVVALVVLACLWGAVVLVASLHPATRRWILVRRREWMLSLFSTALILAAIDLALTLGGFVPTVASQRAQSLEYSFYPRSGIRLVPKTVKTADGEVQINSRGFRGPEIGQTTARRLVFLGGSQVFDFSGGDWPARSGAILRDRGFDVAVINAGVPSHTSTDALIKLVTDVWMLRPAVVFACHGWNDVKYFTRMSGGVPYRGFPPERALTLPPDWRLHPQGVDRLLTASSLYRVVRWNLAAAIATEEGRYVHDELSYPGRGEAFDDHGPRQFELNLTMVVSLTREIGARPLLCRQAWRDRGNGLTGVSLGDYADRNLGLPASVRAAAFEAVDRAVEAVADRHDVPVVDMRGSIADQEANFLDAIHFSDAGSRVAAQVAADAIAPLLE